MTALDISPAAKNNSKIEKKYAELDKYGKTAVDAIIDIEHSRGQRFDPAYLHHTEGRESLENTMFSRLFRFSSKIQKRIKKECYCILRCTLFLGIKKAPLDLSNGVVLHFHGHSLVLALEFNDLRGKGSRQHLFSESVTGIT